MDLGIAGRVALVTGAARGIGRAVAAALAREGVAVAVNDLDPDGAADTARELSQAGPKAVAVPGDVTELPQVAAMAAQTEAELGAIDILVNNAGLWVPKPFVDSTPADWAIEIGINLYGVIHCTHVVLPGMLSRGRGVVVSVTSEAGRVGEPGVVTYSAAKAGVVGFTKALAKEAGPRGVRVNAVALGATRTPQSEATFTPSQWERLAKAYPLRRPGQPADAADAVLFLVSERASWVTGQVYGVNGGYAMP